jgi:ferredoxin
VSGSQLAITVDHDRCMGSGSCAFHAPDTFDLDDSCEIVPLDTSDSDEAFRGSADSCPTHAIGLSHTDEEG